MKFVEKKAGGPLGGKLHGSRFLKQADGRLHIAPGSTWRLAQPNHVEKLQALATEFFGTLCQLEFAAPSVLNSSHQQNRSPSQLSMEEIKHLAGEIFGGSWLTDPTSTSAAEEDSK